MILKKKMTLQIKKQKNKLQILFITLSQFSFFVLFGKKEEYKYCKTTYFNTYFWSLLFVMWWRIFIVCSVLEFKIVLVYVYFLTYCYYSCICVSAYFCIQYMLFLCNSPLLFSSLLPFSSLPPLFPTIPFPSLLIPQVCVLHCRCSVTKTFWLLFTIRNSEKQYDTSNPKSRFCLWL